LTWKPAFVVLISSFCTSAAAAVTQVYICLANLKIYVPALVVGGAALPADLVVLRAARDAGSIAELLDGGGAALRLSQYRSIVTKFALVYKHELDGWCCTCSAFLRDAVCAHDRVWRAFLRLAAPQVVSAGARLPAQRAHRSALMLEQLRRAEQPPPMMRRRRRRRGSWSRWLQRWRPIWLSRPVWPSKKRERRERRERSLSTHSFNNRW
jgi:hypothetical protein